MMYRVCKTDLVLLHSRGKAHEIISHAIAEDPDVEWSDIKRKLMSNYRLTRSEASVKISKLSMTSEETVGEYLARARTLVKSKIKNMGGLLGPRAVRVSGTAETEYASGKPAV